MHPIPDYGDHMTLEIFLACVMSGQFTDDDGHGNYATTEKMYDKEALPSAMFCGIIDKNYTHVVWFNR
jgi:hypothetical protein